MKPLQNHVKIINHCGGLHPLIIFLTLFTYKLIELSTEKPEKLTLKPYESIQYNVSNSKIRIIKINLYYAVFSQKL